MKKTVTGKNEGGEVDTGIKKRKVGEDVEGARHAIENARYARKEGNVAQE